MKLSRTYICLECDELFEPYPDRDINGKVIGQRSECPACGNSACVLLARWLPIRRGGIDNAIHSS